MIQRRHRSPGAQSASTAIKPPNALGVWFNTVTRRSTSRARNTAGSRATQTGTTTTRPPYSSPPHSSHTEKSKAMEWNSVHTSCAPKRYQ